MKILTIAGSLRKASWNRALLRALPELASDGMEFVERALDRVPLFDQDLEERGDPEGVLALKEEIRKADGVLLACPEYNHGMTGVLKNALDWASRPSGDPPLGGTPVGLLGATPGRTGTARAQDQVRQVLKSIGAPCMPGPEVLLARAHERFADDGTLVDEGTRTHLGRFLSAFADWVELHAPRTS